MIIGTPIGHQANLPIGYVKSLLTVKEYSHIFQEGPSIPTNRNEIFDKARLLEDHLLFIDSDMCFTAEDVKRIEKLFETYDIITGVCVMNFPGFPPALFKKNNSYRPLEELPNEIFEVDACGGAFLGISLKVLRTLTEPFTPLVDERTGQSYGEDISFCIRATKEGFKIMCDPSLQIGHIKLITRYYGKA